VYVGGGGSGEGYTLAEPEVRRLQEIAADELPAGAPVRAMGVEPRTAREMSRFLEGAAAAGMQAAQVYSLDVGHGHRPTPAELERYLTEVLDSTRIGCIVSTHQSVGYRIPVDLLASLAERFDHMIGVNCTQPDLVYLDQVIRSLAGRCEVHVGGPGQALTALAFGGRGFLSSEANLAPSTCAAVGAAFDAGDTVELMGQAATVLRLSGLLYGHGGIRATKAALARLGFIGSAATRPPRMPLEGVALDELMVAITGLELGPPQGG
jgi:4-hydroxy-tetrahydrodipicolinate synthase